MFFCSFYTCVSQLQHLPSLKPFGSLALCFHGFLALLNIHLGQSKISALMISFGILPCATISLNLAKGRWFSLMCHLHMCHLVSLFSSTSFCFQSVMTVASKLYGIIGFMLSSPSLILVGLMICMSVASLLTNELMAYRNFPYLLTCFSTFNEPAIIFLVEHDMFGVYPSFTCEYH